MGGTFERLRSHLYDRYRNAKVVIWAHNSHIGDARATTMGSHGELNLGQLLKERYVRQVCSIGFTTYEGTVTAASEWGGPAEFKRVRPAHPDSYEGLFHNADLAESLIQLIPGSPVAIALETPRLERAIGVIYKPETELSSHYFMASLAKQFDAVVHIDTTRAVEPLEVFTMTSETEPAETYPSGV